MTTTIQVLDRESLALLAGLRGQRWRCFGGAQVTDWLTDVSLFAATEESELTVSGEVDDLDFEGHLDSYAGFRVDPGAPDVDAATRRGNLFLQSAGQSVVDVLVLRETVTRRAHGERGWTYVNDIAIVFVLDASAIAFVKVSHNSELLRAVWSESVDDLDIKQPSASWTDTLGVEYVVTRELVAIDG